MTNSHSLAMHYPKVGPPHLREMIRNWRKGYPSDLARSLGDLIDNTIDKAVNITVELIIGTNDKIYNIIVSDDNEDGFENIFEEGSKSPFCFASVREGHTNDDETSEYGTGMKLSAVKMSDKFTIFTRKENDKGGFNYYRIEFNFGTMQNKDKAEDSYSPTIFTEITKQEYEEN